MAESSRGHLSGIYGRGDRIMDVCIGIILTLIIVVTIYPLIYVVSCSFSAPSAVLAGEVVLLPVRPTLMSYQKVFQEGTLNLGIWNSVVYTVVGTAINLVLTSTGAYALSEKTLAGRSIFIKLIMFTMMVQRRPVPILFGGQGSGPAQFPVGRHAAQCHRCDQLHDHEEHV